MASQSLILPIVEPVGLPRGSPEYEQKRTAILEALAQKVRPELRLPPEVISNPPVDVSSIPKHCGILTPAEVDITENYDAFGLAEAIANKHLTAVEVAKAFSKRAIVAHQLTCCLTQWFMDEAIQQAAQLDEYLEKHGKPVGPLHGVPISLKEHVQLAGAYASEGFLASTFLCDKDSQMVSILRTMGAVFYCKTNQPQTIMHLEATSHYGRTLNPYNINLSAGGSSGGEAALCAMRGSVLGVGTDIGGSIRGPSAFCGIYGFKPTSDTLPMRGFLTHGISAELNIVASTGPMCRSLRDMDIFMRIVLSSKPHLLDPRLTPIPWTGLTTPITKPLKIGIIDDDGFIVPQPPVKRAIEWAKKRLSDPQYSDIIQIRRFYPHRAPEAWNLVRRAYWPDGGESLKNIITSSGEPILPLSDWTWKDAEAYGMLNAEEVNDLRDARDKFRYKFIESWQNQDVDIIIGPAFVGPASAHDSAFYWTYTSLYNLVDYPGVVIPTPIRTEANEQYASDYYPLSTACKHVKDLWESSNFEGAPISLQIIARRNHDNELFGALAVLKDILELS